MILGLAQFNPTVGDLGGNAARMKDFVRRAEAARCRLVVFPELSLTGYPPRDFLDYPSFVESNLRHLEELARSVSLPVVCGFIDRNPRAWGAPYANAAALLRGGKVEAVYHKGLLPVYDVFDERRYFEPGGEPFVFELEGKCLAVTICEDAWNTDGFLPRPYGEQPLEAVRAKGAHWVLNISASPFHLGKPSLRRALFAEAARRAGAPVVFCNQVGGNDELLFDGASLAVEPGGGTLLQGPAFAEALLTLDTDRPQAPAPWPDGEAAWIQAALETGIRDYVRKSGASRVVLGLSGGIDSSVVAALAASALGPENVTAVALPTRFTAPESREDAAALAERLGIRFHELAIEPLREAFGAAWRGWFGGDPKSLTGENIQPRLRMTVLMALANERGALLLNTSNKSEIATGYATLYGDSAGAIAVLGDLTKGRVYALARHLNRNGEIIPARVLTRAPTAELKENQTDQDTLPPYDLLDRLVEESVERGRSEGDLLAAGFDPEAVATFARLYRASEYKRYQLPPVLRVTPRAFGVGRRMPLAAAKPF